MNAPFSHEKINWLRLIRSENVGPVTFFRLLERYGSATRALDELPDISKRGGRDKELRIYSVADAEKEMAAVQKIGGTLIYAGDDNYPESVRIIADPPPVLTVLGHVHLLHKPALAIVGARNASLNGRKFAEKLATDLAAKDYVIASGLARGIDAAAHQASLKTGTVAVVAGGADVIYPQENEKLYAEIKERGCIVAENPCGYPPQARDFPRRNRIISGLSQGTIIVEAALKSGSLITATYALEQGRDVFAVPGSPLDPRSTGTNKLLKDGATLIENADDVLHALSYPLTLKENHSPAFAAPKSSTPSDVEIEKAHKIVLEALGPSPVGLDELVRECQVSASIVQFVLLDLELAGRIQRLPGSKIALTYI